MCYKGEIFKIFNNEKLKELGLNPLTLSFSGGMEKEFNAAYLEKSLRKIRFSLILAFIFYILSGLLDLYLFPENFKELLFYRYSVAMPVLIGIFALTYSDLFEKYWQPALAFLTLITSLSILLIMRSAPPPNSYDYYAGIIITLVFAYSFLSLRFIYSAAVGFIVVLCYEFALAFVLKPPAEILIMHSFFMISANIVGCFVAYITEYSGRKDFYLSSLLGAEKEKVKGALDEVRVEAAIRKMAEEELKEARDNIENALMQEKKLSELKSRFISMISHEYRTPLTVIMSSSYLLENFFAMGDMEMHSRHTKKIQTAVKNMTEMMENILKIGVNESKDFDVNPVVFNMADKLGEILYEIKLIDKGSHIFVFDNESGSLMAETDPGLIRQIVTNLLTNAAKYSPEKSEVKLKLSESKNYYQISVKDSGIGIPKEEQDRLFEPFHRFKNVGSVSGIGLGLSIVKRCVDRLKGTIRVISEDGAGAEFIVKLPK